MVLQKDLSDWELKIILTFPDAHDSRGNGAVSVSGPEDHPLLQNDTGTLSELHRLVIKSIIYCPIERGPIHIESWGGLDIGGQI
jgi:hypothetical protein